MLYKYIIPKLDFKSKRHKAERNLSTKEEDKRRWWGECNWSTKYASMKMPLWAASLWEINNTCKHEIFVYMKV
jgi:hypothetical protein